MSQQATWPPRYILGEKEIVGIDVKGPTADAVEEGGVIESEAEDRRKGRRLAAEEAPGGRIAQAPRGKTFTYLDTHPQPLI